MLAEFMVGMAAVAGLGKTNSCDHLYPYQRKISVEAKELCNSWYVSRYDETNRRVLFVSEILDAKTSITERGNKFSPDSRVKNPVKTSMYSNTGYDRGHLAPAGDASNQKEMDESFLLTNIVPQDPKLNRGDWKKLEDYTRSKSKESIYVITGAIYEDSKTINTIPVPSAMYKVIYGKGSTEYWMAKNLKEAKAIRVTKAEIQRKVSYNIP